MSQELEFSVVLISKYGSSDYKYDPNEATCQSMAIFL